MGDHDLSVPRADAMPLPCSGVCKGLLAHAKPSSVTKCRRPLGPCDSPQRMLVISLSLSDRTEDEEESEGSDEADEDWSLSDSNGLQGKMRPKFIPIVTVVSKADFSFLPKAVSHNGMRFSGQSE